LREPWNIAPDQHPSYQSFVFYDQLRYRLMPYLYSMAGWVHLNDYTMMRALVMDFGSDYNVLDLKDQWMFGPSLMACPVSQYKARNRSVYFPKGCGWYDLYTGQHIDGGQSLVVDAPYERIPVYVPEGSIIPFGPAMEWSDEKPAELIQLYIYGGRDAQFTLYEDEGTNYNYERGKYATIDIRYDDKAKTVVIGERQGKFDGMLKTRRFNIVYISAGNAKALNLENPVGVMVEYDGSQTTTKL
jgi:alpha-D-xyloside xylohydrolase